MKHHHRGKSWNALEIGEAYTTTARTITETDLVLFGCLTNDMNPLHTDAVFAAQSPYKKRIAHGAFCQSLMIGLGAQIGIFEGTTIALRQMDTRFKLPVYLGDTVYVAFKVENKKELRGMDQGLVYFRAKLHNQEDQVAIDSTWTVLMKKED